MADAGGSGLRFGILGPLRISVGTRDLALASRKQRTLLAALLTAAGSVVSADRLADILWGDEEPADPAGALQTHVSRLRMLLETEAGPDARQLLVTQPPGYLLLVNPLLVDANRFERQVGEARSAPTPRAAAELLERALGLWRGPALAEFDHAHLRAAATRLEELRLAAVELRAAALLAMHRDEQVVSELEGAVAQHPLREHLRGHLMVALTRCGRQADALAVYRDLRDRLVDELGVDPAAHLRNLEQAILQQADELPWPGWVPGTEPQPSPSQTPVPDEPPLPRLPSLPEPLTSFVGRDVDVGGVTGALAKGRIVVLTGAGGVGKSRLALHVARSLANDYPDGVDLCDLVDADGPGAVADVVATNLGALPSESANPEAAVIDFLRTQRRLVVLDNCEHVLAGASELVQQIGRWCPAVDVLATSQRPLEVAGQQIWPVHPLAVGDDPDGPAVALFRDRAVAADPTFDLDETNLDAVREICARLDGLPLAVELAAARVRSLAPADIAARLDDRFGLLEGPPRAATPRHHSLQAVVDWSLALLPEPTRRLFERLTVFTRTFGIGSAEQVCWSEGLATEEIVSRLAALVDHSLVAVDRVGPDARYRLLETMRSDGRRRLEERGDLATWRQRHAEHFTALAEAATSGIEGPEEATWVRRIDVDLANLRAAHAWALTAEDADLALRLSAGLRPYAYLGLHDEIYEWAIRALGLPNAEDSSHHPAALVTAAVGWMQRGELERALACGEQVLDADPGSGVTLRARRLLAEVALYQGRLEATEQHGGEIIEGARAAGRPYDEALGHLYRVHAATYDGRQGAAEAELAAGWRIAERLGSPTLQAGFWFLEGETRLDADPATALAAFGRAITTARSVGNRFVEGVSRVAAASLEARHGHPTEALRSFRDVIDHWRTSGDWAHMWTTLRNLLVLFERIGADPPAAVLLGAVETATTGAPAFGADAQRLRASHASLRARLGKDAFDDALTTGQQMSDEEAVLDTLETIGRLLAEADPVA